MNNKLKYKVNSVYTYIFKLAIQIIVHRMQRNREIYKTKWILLFDGIKYTIIPLQTLGKSDKFPFILQNGLLNYPYICQIK